MSAESSQSPGVTGLVPQPHAIPKLEQAPVGDSQLPAPRRKFKRRNLAAGVPTERPSKVARRIDTAGRSPSSDGIWSPTPTPAPEPTVPENPTRRLLDTPCSPRQVPPTPMEITPSPECATPLVLSRLDHATISTESEPPRHDSQPAMPAAPVLGPSPKEHSVKPARRHFRRRNLTSMPPQSTFSESSPLTDDRPNLTIPEDMLAPNENLPSPQAVQEHGAPSIPSSRSSSRSSTRSRHVRLAVPTHSKLLIPGQPTPQSSQQEPTTRSYPYNELQAVHTLIRHPAGRNRLPYGVSALSLAMATAHEQSVYRNAAAQVQGVEAKLRDLEACMMGQKGL
ncbi:hypothetical protein NLJ89_g10835 [Agrocybe chaxingu]|uniref:Uncharacterized protein n=1 Tax=Agrocybe chaxingu TaxID=84603 RepID=A0A9W8JR13_9AGAR|nr:hypothetical protein NLJ89_g10835 [Agrocybe chaxingu]